MRTSAFTSANEFPHSPALPPFSRISCYYWEGNTTSRVQNVSLHHQRVLWNSYEIAKSCENGGQPNDFLRVWEIIQCSAQPPERVYQCGEHYASHTPADQDTPGLRLRIEAVLRMKRLFCCTSNTFSVVVPFVLLFAEWSLESRITRMTWGKSLSTWMKSKPFFLSELARIEM